MPVIKNEMQLNYLDFSKRKMLHLCNKQFPICYGCGSSMEVPFDLEIVKNYIGNCEKLYRQHSSPGNAHSHYVCFDIP